MANILEDAVYAAIKPGLESWLKTRALVLPAAKVAEIAKKLNTSAAVVQAVNQELIAQAVAAVDSFKP